MFYICIIVYIFFLNDKRLSRILVSKQARLSRRIVLDLKRQKCHGVNLRNETKGNLVFCYKISFILF